MTAKRAGRSGRPWRTAVAWLKANTPPICGRCGQPIDLRLRHPHPQSWTAGHIIDLALRPDLAEDRNNLRPEHLHCNASAGATAGNRRRGRPTLNTSRTW